MEVCGDDDETETGEGLDETSWAMMRLYACRRRGLSEAEVRRVRDVGARTFATASTDPQTVRTRSWTPGVTLLTPALTPVCSLRSATFFPPFPMITPASFVVTRARRVRTSWAEVGDVERDAAGDALVG